MNKVFPDCITLVETMMGKIMLTKKIILEKTSSQYTKHIAILQTITTTATIDDNNSAIVALLLLLLMLMLLILLLLQITTYVIMKNMANYICYHEKHGELHMLS